MVGMSNSPWLDVPLADYEGHMTAQQVGQLHVLADAFAGALQICRPESVIVLGVAGGNGLDRIDGAVTARVAGIDIHPGYLEAVRERYPFTELHCLDLARELAAQIAPAALVHAAFVFEHAGVDLCLRNAIDLTSPGGTLSVILQLPSTETAAVASTGYASIQGLAGHFQLIDPAWLASRLAEDGFALRQESRRDLPSGKALWHGLFQR
jgi:hypothetical protein